jgi:GST-like protein
MIDLYFFPSPNTWKVSIALEELGAPYRIVPVDITAGAQHDPAFRAISPNGRVPAIRDAASGRTLFESGAILLWLAETSGELLPPDGPARWRAMQWLFWQTAGLGPMAGQAHHFRRYAAPDQDYARGRYEAECVRLYGVLDAALAGSPYLAGDYSIADIACWTWVWYHPMHGIDLGRFRNVASWYDAIGARPAVRRGRAAGLDMLSDEVRPMFDGAAYSQPIGFAAERTRVG